MDIVKYKEECKELWLKENAHKSQLYSNNIVPMKPDLGYYLKVNNIDIYEDIFKEEYEIIHAVYFSVIEKLDKYYKNI